MRYHLTPVSMASGQVSRASAGEYAKSLSRVRLCDPIDGSPPGSSVHGIFQARVLEWGAISFSVEQLRHIHRPSTFLLLFFQSGY